MLARCVRDILKSSAVFRELAEMFEPQEGMIPVRGIIFDKTPEENGALRVILGFASII